MSDNKMKVLALSEHCEDCRDRYSSQPTYSMIGDCWNCHSGPFEMRFPMGVETVKLGCPVCGCSEVRSKMTRARFDEQAVRSDALDALAKGAQRAFTLGSQECPPSCELKPYPSGRPRRVVTGVPTSSIEAVEVALLDEIDSDDYELEHSPRHVELLTNAVRMLRQFVAQRDALLRALGDYYTNVPGASDRALRTGDGR